MQRILLLNLSDMNASGNALRFLSFQQRNLIFNKPDILVVHNISRDALLFTAILCNRTLQGYDAVIGY
jgi:hypothetical protein